MARLMIVDDEPDTLKTVKALLEREGYEVVTASNVGECLNKLKKEDIELILLDILMPGIAPVELIKKIKKDKKLSSTKVAYLTVVELTKKELEKVGISGYIRKPFDNADLVKSVKKILGK